MFALGGSHLELGDHMLSREYFPAAPLAMSPQLREAIVHYYDSSRLSELAPWDDLPPCLYASYLDDECRYPAHGLASKGRCYHRLR